VWLEQQAACLFVAALSLEPWIFRGWFVGGYVSGMCGLQQDLLQKCSWFGRGYVK
jgi:hypothetical protein